MLPVVSWIEGFVRGENFVFGVNQLLNILAMNVFFASILIVTVFDIRLQYEWGI